MQAPLGKPQVKPSAKVLGKGNLDESRTVVTGGGNAAKQMINGTEVVNISSDSSGGEENSEEEDESADESAAGDIAMEDVQVPIEAPTPEDAEEETAEPSFGDLVRANASEPIDVAGAFEDEDRALTYTQRNQIKAPSRNSPHTGSENK
jgi:U3 small nucleolar RNA-associated protein 5